jgi:multicomponent Na+:H+ antiporter subunit D
MMLATGVTVALSIAYIVAAGPIHDLATRAGTDLLEPTIYIDAVLGGDR